VPERQTTTVLVVDDMPDARDVLARLLRRQGYVAATADHGLHALAQVDAVQPDLVLLDLTMPVMDGVEVLRRLRADPRYADLPVVVFTGVQGGPMVDEARRLRARDVVLKASPAAWELVDRIPAYLAAPAGPPATS
jgi:chemosensory pili system protein ChpA (sensor histidine kinase/response regulator)